MRRWRRREGFTMIEMTVVAAIISILAAIAIPIYLSQQGRAKNTVAETTARGAMEYLQGKYQVEGSTFPSAYKVVCGESGSGLGDQDTSYKWARPANCGECETDAAACQTLDLSDKDTEVGVAINEEENENQEKGKRAEVCAKSEPGNGNYYCVYQNNEEGTKLASEEEGTGNKRGSLFCVINKVQEGEFTTPGEKCTEANKWG